MAVLRIYTIGYDGVATLRRELRDFADLECFTIAFAMQRALPEERTWFLDFEPDDALEATRH